MQMGMHGQNRLPPAPRRKYSAAKSQLETALKGGGVDESFQKAILDTMLVYLGRRPEVRLNLLPENGVLLWIPLPKPRRKTGVIMTPLYQCRSADPSVHQRA